MRWAKLKTRRGDLSGPVLAILVTLILIAIGAAIIAYLTLFTGGTGAPIIAIKGQPVAYNQTGNAIVELVIVNTGNALLSNGTAELNILTGGLGSKTAPVGDLPPGASKTLTFTYTGAWSTLKTYAMATGVLKVTDRTGNTAALYEVSIRVVGSS